MDGYRRYLSLNGKSPLYQMFISLLVIMGAGILLFLGFLYAGILIFDTDLEVLEISTREMSQKNISFFKYLLIAQDISLFIIPSIIIFSLIRPASQSRFSDLKAPRIDELVLVILLAFCLFPITGFMGELNAGMHLPDWLSGVERWMIEKEDNASGLIDNVIVSYTFWGMILNVIMIAVIPAIGEEMIFRGVFQKIFYDLFKSGHLAIWTTAFIFSAIHFQFFGFLPRLILGLVFGYLFFWSGTLWLPVIAHFVNNAVPVVASYIQKNENYDFIPDISFWEQQISLTLPVVISIVILGYLRSGGKKSEDNCQ